MRRGLPLISAEGHTLKQAVAAYYDDYLPEVCCKLAPWNDIMKNPATLGATIHALGVNMRHLGILYDLAPKGSQSIRLLLLREMVFRTLKSIVRQRWREYTATIATQPPVVAPGKQVTAPGKQVAAPAKRVLKSEREVLPLFLFEFQAYNVLLELSRKFNWEPQSENYAYILTVIGLMVSLDANYRELTPHEQDMQARAKRSLADEDKMRVMTADLGSTLVPELIQLCKDEAKNADCVQFPAFLTGQQVQERTQQEMKLREEQAGADSDAMLQPLQDLIELSVAQRRPEAGQASADTVSNVVMRRLAIAAKMCGALRHATVLNESAEYYISVHPVSYTHLTLPTNREV